MLKAQLHKTVRHGWHIEIGEDKGAFYFECSPPEYPAPCDDGLYYTSREAALEAAYDFVEREVALLGLIEVANDWLEAGLISEKEYWNMTDFA